MPRPPFFPAGDSGLVSAADDFHAFASFMLTANGPDGRRLLSDASLRQMTSNHLTLAQQQDGVVVLGPNRAWGYGMGVMTADSPDGIPAGAYGCDGGFGTSYHDRPVDEDGVSPHKVDQFCIRPFGVAEAKRGVGRSLFTSRVLGVMPMRVINSTSRARLGGVFRYSISVDSMPVARITASVFLDCRIRGYDRS
jgi:hypothetical protein